MKVEWIKSVRSIATVILILTYSYLCIKGVIKAENLQVVIAMVITFYFTKPRGGGNGKGISGSNN